MTAESPARGSDATPSGPGRAPGRVNPWFWGVATFLCVGVGGYALFHAATGLRHLPLENDFPTPVGLFTHVTASGVALILGPVQFLGGLRAARPTLHRWVGRIYVLACLIGGAAGGVIALFSQAGLTAGIGFLTLSILWLLVTGLALRAATRRDFAAHKAWMVRSFALTFAAVTLRLYLPIGIMLGQGEFNGPYTIIAWACWVPNLILAEIWLRTRAQVVARPA